MKEKETLRKVANDYLTHTKSTKGITLIALVITIIVLLILASVSIAMLSGENGILNKAQDAKEKTIISSEKELLSLAYAAGLIEHNGQGVTADELQKELDNSVGTGKTIVTDNGDGTFNVKFTDTEHYYFVESGNVSQTEAPLVNQITAANYGDKVTYTANGVSDWKIFYNDGTNVFIIASDYLAHGGESDTSKIVSGTGMEKTGSYRAYWSSAPSSADTTNHIAKFSPVTTETKKWRGNYSTNKNGKCVSTLLDTTLWSSYASGVGGESAIGSPTLNMFVASWNEKYPSDKIYCNNDSATGYYVGTSSAPTTYSANLSGKSGYGNTLYYPYQSTVGSGNCCGYWLASPCGYNNTFVMGVSYRGYVNNDQYHNTVLGVRPVVSLSSGVKGTSTTADGVTTWTLSN